ncbi:MAG: DEAD/DEAH box helicase [Candidatus Rokubacteria bacterium]|nr:DEAD/DEAH box helicase [Candidatus Rokubacteria bacterium]
MKLSLDFRLRQARDTLRLGRSRPILTDILPKELGEAYRAGRLGATQLDLYRTFQARYPFALDGFQARAIAAILEGDSVIVSAPTGAGKTLIAEFAIYQALLRRQRIAYTTPLKALSNQKYADFCRQFGVAEVGVLTGDVKVNPRAPVLVMTTEILRNMFYAGGLPGLAAVVLDECHYMGDPGRGTVWEEIIVNAPKNAALVALSATVANVTEIADWISLVHRPIVPVLHPDRPVPLEYLMVDLSGEIHALDAVHQGKVRLVGHENGRPERWGDRREGDGDRRRWVARRVADPTLVIEDLAGRGWLPAIYFIFSRAGCERAMESYLAEGQPLLTRPQQREVESAIHDACQESPAMVESSLNQTIFRALGMGVGLHHAGILPSLKRLTELLFERGLCRAVFATETMSLGIHMPARSVVLQGLTKRTDRGFRGLTHNELTQMAGRAGRRGIDPEGKCVIALDSRDSLEEALRTVDGPPEPVESQFRLGYGSVALLLDTGKDQETIRRIVESSFGQYQNLKRIRGLEREVESLGAALAEARGYPAPCGDFSRIGRYRQVRAEVEALRRAFGRGGARRGEAVATAEPGRLVLLRRRGGGSLAAILSIHSVRGSRVLVDALLPHGVVVRVKSGNIKKVFWATPPLPVPRDWRQRQNGLAEQLRRLSLSDLIEHERGHGSEAELSAIECHRCPWGAQPRCEAAWKHREKLESKFRQRDEALGALKNAYWLEFCRVVEVLEEFGAVKGGHLLPKGQLVAGLRHDNELLVAEIVERGILDNVSLAEAAALCSCLIEEARSGENAAWRLFLKKRPGLRKKLHQMEAAGEAVWQAQRARHLTLPGGVQPGFMPAVFRWASGDDDWAGIVEESFGGHEGDLIRAMRRLIDLLRQLAEASHVATPVATLLGQAARVVDRGIVLESALI